MPMKNNEPKLYLTVQYGEGLDELLSRQRLRAWFSKMWHFVTDILELDCTAIEIALRFVAESEGRRLNYQFRSKDYATNILTFEYGTNDQGVIQTDLVLCISVLEKESKEQSKSLENHMMHLLLHGLLHALGFEHLNEEEANEMESLEIEILQKMGLPNPYLG